MNSLKFAGFAFLMLAGLRLLAGFGADSHPPPWPQTIAVAVAVALFLVYGIPALMSLLPGSIVIVSEKGINNNVMSGRGWAIRFWPWDEIAYCSIAMDNAGGKSYKVLSLHADDDCILATVALSDRPSRPDIEE